MRKQLKPRIVQPLVGGGLLDARLQLSLRSALARNERTTYLPVVQLVLRVEIFRARTVLPLIFSVTVPLHDVALTAMGGRETAREQRGRFELIFFEKSLTRGGESKALTSVRCSTALSPVNPNAALVPVLSAA